MNSKASKILGVSKSEIDREAASSPPSAGKPRFRYPATIIKSSSFVAKQHSASFHTGASHVPQSLFTNDTTKTRSDTPGQNALPTRGEACLGKPRRNPTKSSLSIDTFSSASSRNPSGMQANGAALESISKLPRPGKTDSLSPQETINADESDIFAHKLQRQLAKPTRGVPAQLLLRKMSLQIAPLSPPPESALPFTPASARKASSAIFLTTHGAYHHGAIAIGKARRLGSVGPLGDGFVWENIIGGDFRQNGEDVAMDATVYYYIATFAGQYDMNRAKSSTARGKPRGQWLNAPRLDETLIRASATRQVELEGEEDGHVRPALGPNVSSLSNTVANSPRSDMISNKRRSRSNFVGGMSRFSSVTTSKSLSVPASLRSSVEAPKKSAKKTGKRGDVFASFWTRRRRSKISSTSFGVDKNDKPENPQLAIHSVGQIRKEE